MSSACPLFAALPLMRATHLDLFCLVFLHSFPWILEQKRNCSQSNIVVQELCSTLFQNLQCFYLHLLPPLFLLLQHNVIWPHGNYLLLCIFFLLWDSWKLANHPLGSLPWEAVVRVAQAVGTCTTMK